MAQAVDRDAFLMHTKESIEQRFPIGRRECLLGALWGIFVGDSLGLPTDGSVNLRACERDYQRIEEIIGPYSGTHADGGMHLAIHSHLEHIGLEPSIFHPYTVHEKNRKSDIMDGKDVYHGLPGVHMHRCLEAGSNTLTCKLSNLIISSILERQEFCRDRFLASYLQFMLDEPNKDTFIDPYHIEFFERYSRGNKPYYSAGIGKASFEATSTALVQIVPLIIFLLQQEEFRDGRLFRGEGKYSYSNLQYSTRHASARVIADSIFDVVYQYIELFFRSEKLQQFCYQFARTMKKILLGGNLKDILYESASQINMEMHMLLQMDDHEVLAVAALIP
eukprot:CAMPEP_0172154848 /NCGR_PEP_ID=MMETSP1050-20130122/2276_1 /TAXON_ID=233186 /ORGANISM="Cryptomonas curvata, Strain CCAP979/52" /LENGTH=333 /DNA_ID=CAMNT_0012823637 /DNA_START=1169 /DNA_END=2170 /DNA_ORIENTATION=+